VLLLVIFLTYGLKRTKRQYNSKKLLSILNKGRAYVTILNPISQNRAMVFCIFMNLLVTMMQVEMPAKAEAQSAIEGLNGKDLKGRSLNVNEARPRSQGRRGGARFGGPRHG
jgi:hypothetical protein